MFGRNYGRALGEKVGRIPRLVDVKFCKMHRTKNFAVSAALLSMICVQGGASIAKQLFPLIGPVATSAMRIGLAALLLNLIIRPNLLRFNQQQWLYCLFYGVGIAAMNLIFYLAIQRIPLGLGVTIEFIGPLFLAFALSRKWMDVLWAILAGMGILLIVPWGQNSIDLTGVLLAFLAGLFWAVYIVMGRKVSRVLDGRDAVATGMIIASALVIPFAIVDGGLWRMTDHALLLALLLAVLSSALPFSLEMMAMSKLPTRTFSILTSLQPAFAALSGLFFLSEQLGWMQWLSVSCVVFASLGTTWGSRGEP